MGKFVFYSIPCIQGSLGKNKGCEKAPDFIFSKLKIFPEKLEFLLEDIEKQNSQILGHALQTFKEKKLPFFIGGTHDITFSLFNAFAKSNKNPVLLIFDAHADSDEGTIIPSHEDFVRALVEQKIIAPEKIMIVGLRKIYPSEESFLSKSGVRFILSSVVHSNFSETLKMIQKFINEKDLYVSFDVDCLSNRIMLATHYTPRGGLTEKEAKIFLNEVIPKAKAVDLVEFNPQKITLREDELIQRLFLDLL
jgi:arginase family enzyme